MPALNLLIKPASSLCNMGCRYCFYRDVAENRNTSSFGIMSEKTVDAMLKNVFSYADARYLFLSRAESRLWQARIFTEAFTEA